MAIYKREKSNIVDDDYRFVLYFNCKSNFKFISYARTGNDRGDHTFLFVRLKKGYVKHEFKSNQ